MHPYSVAGNIYVITEGIRIFDSEEFYKNFLGNFTFRLHEELLAFLFTLRRKVAK